MFNLFKKSPKTQSPEEESVSSKLGNAVREKTEIFTKFLSEKLENAKEEFTTIKEKTKNLRSTNYLLGLKHLENGKLPEAIFRFRFTTKMWPDYDDAFFLLAYCLTLDEKLLEAKKILEDLLQRNPSYDQKARDLLENINSNLEQSKSDA